MELDALEDRAGEFMTALAAWAAEAVPDFLAALTILIVGWWLASWASRALDGWLERQGRVDPTLHDIFAATVRYAILVLVIVAVLGQLGVQTTSILAALGAAGLAIGLALQGTLSNIAAGIMLLWLRPFKNGDYIETESFAGTVVSISLFTSELHSWDGIYQFIPNSELWNRRLVNYSRLPTRLIDLKFGIGYDDDIALAKQVLMDMARSEDRVLAAPEPQAFVGDLGDSAVVINLRVWASTADYWPTRRELTERGKIELDKAGLTIPFPQRDIHLIQAAGSA